MITGDFHTHTKASDGHSTFAENIEIAESKELCTFAATDHSFTNMLLHMTRKKFFEQAQAIEKNNASGRVKVLHGIEANINTDGTLDVPIDLIPKLDILNLGFHRLIQFKEWRGSILFLFGNGWFPRSLRKELVQKNTLAYLGAMDRYPIDVLCHLNHRCLVDTKIICEKAVEKGIYVELNEKHIESLTDDIDIVLASGVKLILGSDAHYAKNVGAFPRVEEFIKSHNIPHERIFGLDGLAPEFKDKSMWIDREFKETKGKN